MSVECPPPDPGEELRGKLHALVALRLAELCKNDSQALPVDAARRRALDYRAFALMNDPPGRVRRLARRLIEEREFEGLDDERRHAFCRALCTTLAEIYETVVASR